MEAMSFFTFCQNNSGGRLDPDMPHVLFVEADDAEAANTRALTVGVYFDGCETGDDCNCCGDRWSRAHKGFATPDAAGYEWARRWGVLRRGADKWEPLEIKP